MQALTSDIVRNSYGDGLFATMFATLTSGVFLTGFALHLGMDVRAIGLLAALPYAATLFQLPVSVAIARRGNQKPLALGHAFAGRLLWLPILAVGLTPLGSPSTRIAMVLGLVFISHACISVSYVAWLSWMSELVPPTDSTGSCTRLCRSPRRLKKTRQGIRPPAVGLEFSIHRQ